VKRKGCRREAGSEGSVDQKVRADEQKPDMRRKRRTSGRHIAKSRSIKDAKRRSGGCAPKAIELTPGGLPGVALGRLRRPRGRLTAGQKSAEGVLGQAVGKAIEALQGRKVEKQIGGAGNDGRRPERSREASRTGIS
jgi:hypothetical protein